MAESKVDYTNVERNESLMDQTFDSLESRLGKSKDTINDFFEDFDPRIIRYKADTFGKLVDKMDDLVDDQSDLRSGQNYYNHAYQGYRNTKRAVEDINSAMKLGDIAVPAVTAVTNALDSINPGQNDLNNVDPKIDEKAKEDEDKKKKEELNKLDNDNNNDKDNDVDNDNKKKDDLNKLKAGAEVIRLKEENGTVTPSPLKELDTNGEPTNSSLSTSIGKTLNELGENIIDTIENGPARLRQQISPYSGNVGATKGMNKATAGIIAAASVAASGAGVGGGLLATKKLSVTRFTPEDWNALGVDYQASIEKIMNEVGFSNEEIETFKHSYFKIATADLKEHIKKLDKVISYNPTIDDEFLKLYNFSMIDNQGKVNEYLLFITMIIDGRNTIDNYNMYSVINQSLEDADDVDFFYTGIDMEDYYDDDAEEDVDILNDPTQKDDSKTDEEEAKLETETKIESNEEPIEEVKEEKVDTTKEWLKGIGIEDY